MARNVRKINSLRKRAFNNSQSEVGNLPALTRARDQCFMSTFVIVLWWRIKLIEFSVIVVFTRDFSSSRWLRRIQAVWMLRKCTPWIFTPRRLRESTALFLQTEPGSWPLTNYFMPGREGAILTEKAGSCYHPQAFPLGVKNGSKGMSFLSIFLRQTMPSHTQSHETIDPVDLDLDRKSLICVAIADIFKVSFRFSA